ncbi:MaoC/PaaZ C-terminal domain-containing protein [Micromonospora sp. WMMD1102]|uniref:MaoC/PaaZ C-terminal domain-containing protein n=1 Tax=Micromonospora sp. WMMD1102 TaxID=3016105 RepID=UPI0024158041|nr:MaoC/PaaZ C-terminal domain-containing protein [Micromonospora sp. WMMD1102]MDG4790746.1 MaoC/PaaZ C-terminal domain-containing protein [Micromonospora sp. WMMD1102]MDG4792218.1 MaoC/PaaZ C-terminal domain-containing protein [Micromonospora sp. WMMD1102]
MTDLPHDTGEQPAAVPVELAAVPVAGPLYRRAAIGLAPGFGSARRADRLPGTVLVVRGVAVDRDHLVEYDRVCGFRLADALPPTYPHVLAFPLALHLMSAPEFPLPLVGLVHVANRIDTYRPIDAAEPLDLAVRAVDLRPHERGRQFDVVCTASVAGETVWRGVSTYLRRERTAAGGDRRDPGDRPAAPAPTTLWRVAARVGREYARVSGDRNPIHTSRVAARLFGFPRPIAHGMWSKARCLAALEGRLPEAYTVDVAFKLPVPLPSTVAFSASRGRSFGLHDPARGRPYLLGEVTPDGGMIRSDPD